MISLYGACILPEDNNLALVLLYELMHLQLPRYVFCRRSHILDESFEEFCSIPHRAFRSDELRRLLQNGNCTFSRCYKAFVEAHIPAKLFLTSALRNAIIQVMYMYLCINFRILGNDAPCCEGLLRTPKLQRRKNEISSR